MFCLSRNNDLEYNSPLQQWNVVSLATETCDVSELKVVPLAEPVAVVHA